MAFGIGVNTEHPDRGKWQGRQEDVACDCWFSSTGMTIPATEYRCSSLYEGVEYRFRLIFHMEDCRWKLIWEN